MSATVERRAVLTVDLDCERCHGTGRIRYREDRPGAQVRCGGGPIPQVTRERLCGCVLPAPIYSTPEGTVIGAPVRGGRG